MNVDSLELVRPRSVAVEPVGLWAMLQVNFVGLLIEVGISGRLRAAILGVIIGRMAAGFRTGRARLAGPAQCAGRITGCRFWAHAPDNAVVTFLAYKTFAENLGNGATAK